MRDPESTPETDRSDFVSHFINKHVQLVAVNRLVPAKNNAKRHSPQQIQKLATSISTVGFLNPILTDADLNIIAGHARLEAAKQQGLEKVPILCIEHLSPDALRAYRIADNRLAELADWDKETLAIELADLASLDLNFDLEITGFETPEIDLMIQGLAPEPDAAETLPVIEEALPAVTRTGDIWECDTHRIACGDCRDPDLIDALMGDDQAQQVITDPPYNVAIQGHVRGLGKNQHDEFAMASGEMSSQTFSIFLQDSLTQLARVSLDGSLHYVFMDWRHLPELMKSGTLVYTDLINLIVWAKTNGGMGSLYRSQHELVLLFKKGHAPHINNIELGKFNRYRTNVWTYSGVNAFGPDRNESLAMHPTVKPVDMFADAILDVTHRGDVVLDGFLGSGTTLLAAERTGRCCRGVEIDPRYVDVALHRWMNSGGAEPVHIESGQPFSAVADARNRRPQPGVVPCQASITAEDAHHV